MKQEKIGLTTTNWILSIIGIILLSLLIILPPVFRVIFKEEEKSNKEEIVTYPTLTTTCYKEEILTDISNNTETYIFQHQNNKLKSYTKTINKIYSDPTEYELEKQNFGRLVALYSVLNGYNYTLIPNDENLSLIIEENYDLEIFTSTKVVIPGNTEPTLISSIYLLNDSISNIETSLTTNDYLCSKNE